MEIKSYADILNLQKNFAATIEKQIQALSQPEGNPSALLIQLKQEALKQAQAALAAARDARDVLAKRLDQSLEQRSAVVAQLQADIGNLQKAAGVEAPVVKAAAGKRKRK